MDAACSDLDGNKPEWGLTPVRWKPWLSPISRVETSQSYKFRPIKATAVPLQVKTKRTAETEAQREPKEKGPGLKHYGLDSDKPSTP
eukprot:2480545-Amphidinium_carterae.1